MNIIDVGMGYSYIPEAKAIVAQTQSATLFDDKDLLPIYIGNLKVAPWGLNNDLPQKIRDKAEINDVVSANIAFNTNVAFGLGPKPMKRIIENNKVVGYEELISGKEVEFFDENNISLFLQEQLTDINYFGNSFPEIILSGDKKNIVSLRSKEAMFSRWSVMNSGGVIEKHLYCANWDKNPIEKDIIVSETLDDYNPYKDLVNRLKNKKYNAKRFILSTYVPSPGRTYYPIPNWYSIFRSGWYDHAVTIPLLKNTILKNNLGVKFIIYISDKYWDNFFAAKGINTTDIKAVEQAKAEEIETLSNFASGQSNAGKAIAVPKTMRAVSTGTAEEKYIEIVPIKNDLTGGELLQDSEEANNVICYSMGVHPSLIGATPGKNKGNLGGTDKRELFMIKQALSKSLIQRVLRPFNLIKKFNNWNKDFVVQVPEYTFTTLDQQKSGKTISVENTTTKL